MCWAMLFQNVWCLLKMRMIYNITSFSDEVFISDGMISNGQWHYKIDWKLRRHWVKISCRMLRWLLDHATGLHKNVGWKNHTKYFNSYLMLMDFDDKYDARCPDNCSHRRETQRSPKWRKIAQHKMWWIVVWNRESSGQFVEELKWGERFTESGCM